MAYTDFIAAIDLGSSHMVGMVGTKGPAGTLSIIAYEVENSDTCIRRGCVYNIKDAAGKIVRLIRKEELLDVVAAEAGNLEVVLMVGAGNIELLVDPVKQILDKKE